MKIFIGGGGLAREVYDYVKPVLYVYVKDAINVDKIFYQECKVVKSIDMLCGLPSLACKCSGSWNDWYHTTFFYLCIGDPIIKKRAYDELPVNFKSDCLYKPVNNGMNSSSIKFGKGIITMPTSYISAEVEIGNFVLINYGATIGHHTKIGDFSSINPNASVAGNCKIGNNVLIGAGSNIKEGISIGDRTIVGMGAVVLKDIPSDCVAVGNPASVFTKEEFENAKLS